MPTCRSCISRNRLGNQRIGRVDNLIHKRLFSGATKIQILKVYDKNQSMEPLNMYVSKRELL